jgi:hypothetical protein
MFVTYRTSNNSYISLQAGGLLGFLHVPIGRNCRESDKRRLETLLEEFSSVSDVRFELSLYVRRMEVSSLSSWGSALNSVPRVFSPVEVI